MKKMDMYKEKREEYEAFYKEKLEKIPEIEAPTSEERRREQRRATKKTQDKRGEIPGVCLKTPPVAPCLRGLHQKAETEEAERMRKEQIQQPKPENKEESASLFPYN
jgi:hypothetical protein